MKNNSFFTSLSPSLLEAAKKSLAKKLDPVGKEDGDINNDGKTDSTDSYLKTRRAAISKNVKEDTGLQEMKVKTLMSYAMKAQKEGGRDKGVDTAIKKIATQKEDVDQIDELSKKTLGSYVKKAKDRLVNPEADKGRGPDTPSWSMRAANNADRRAANRSKGIDKAADKMTKEEVELDEAKAESPTLNTRLISKHEGKDGHHAEIRRDKDMGEYQVHHYENGKHMGEGPVSFHGSDKEGKQDAQDTVDYELKHYRPVNGRLLKHGYNEEVETLDEAAMTSHDRYTDSHKNIKSLLKSIGDHLDTHKKNAMSHRSVPRIDYPTGKVKIQKGPTWGHVGDIDQIHNQLKDIHDRLASQGEYAG
jgi:hypothetical protein